MKMYMVEFENLVSNDPVIKIFSGESENDVLLQCQDFAHTHDYVGLDFDMYPIYRNSDGQLFLGEVE